MSAASTPLQPVTDSERIAPTPLAITGAERPTVSDADGAGVVAKLLAGVPAADVQIASLNGALAPLARAVAEASPAERLRRFDEALAERSDANEILRAVMSIDPRAASVPSISAADDGWATPIPLENYQAPAFPIDALPKTVGNFVRDLATETQCPADFVAVLALAALAAACAKLVEVEVRGGWREPVNLYTLGVLPPASRKSQVFRRIVSPFNAAQRELTADLAPFQARAASERRVLEQALANAERVAANADTAEKRREALDRARETADALSQLPMARTPRLVADDATPEKLVGLTRDSGGRLFVASAEGSGPFALMSGRYSQNGVPSIEIFLKGHAGDDLVVDRVGRASEIVADPALTLAICAQPEVLRGLAARAGFRGLGLLARFLYACPPSNLGRREVEPPPMTPAVEAEYERLIRSLLGRYRPSGENGEWPTTRFLRLNDAAYAALIGFAREVESRLADGGDLRGIADWAGKLVGATARIGGLLHMADVADEPAPWDVPIGPETIAAAISIARWSVGHAQAAFGQMGADEAVDEAKVVLGWIRRRGSPSFSRSDAYQALRGSFGSSTALDRPLALLEANSFVRRRPSTQRTGAGRPPTPTYDVNPRMLSENADNPINPAPLLDGGDFQDSLDFVRPSPESIARGADDSSEGAS